jgi:hypothetical protein
VPTMKIKRSADSGCLFFYAASDFLMGSPNILCQEDLKDIVGLAGGLGNRARPPQ